MKSRSQHLSEIEGGRLLGDLVLAFERLLQERGLP